MLPDYVRQYLPEWPSTEKSKEEELMTVESDMQSVINNRNPVSGFIRVSVPVHDTYMPYAPASVPTATFS